MELIKKLEGLSSVYFKSKVKHICCAPNSCISNAQLFYTIDILDEAIEKKRKVEFEYCNYDIDKELHPRNNNDGTVRKYIVNPYQMVTMSGRYYLICNYDKYDDISNYRVDRIKNIRILNTSIKPVEKTNGKKFGLNLPEHMSEHVYMFSGDIIQVKFRANSYILNDIIDYFGTSADFSDVTEKDFIVRVRISEEDMFRWAVQFSDHAVVLEPVTLKERIIDALKSALNNYSK